MPEKSSDFNNLFYVLSINNIFSDIIPKKLSIRLFLTALICRFYLKYSEELAELKKNNNEIVINQKNTSKVAVQKVVAPANVVLENVVLEKIDNNYFNKNEAAILGALEKINESNFKKYKNENIEIKALSDLSDLSKVKNIMQNTYSLTSQAQNYPFLDEKINLNFSEIYPLLNFNEEAIKYDFIILNSEIRGENSPIQINLIFSDKKKGNKYYLVLQAKAFEIESNYKEAIKKGAFIFREYNNIKFLKEAQFAQNNLKQNNLNSLNSIIVEEAKRILQLFIKINSKDEFVAENPKYNDFYQNDFILICNCLSCIDEYAKDEQDKIIALKKQVSNQEKKFKLLFEFIKSKECSDDLNKLYQKVTFAEVHN